MRPGGGFALKKINDPGLILGTKEYVAPESTLAALEQVALQILNPELIAQDQLTCPDVLAHKAGNMPRNVVVGNVDMLGTTLFCEISDKTNPRPLLPKQQRN